MSPGEGPGIPTGAPIITVVLIIIFLPIRPRVAVSLFPGASGLGFGVAFLSSSPGSTVIRPVSLLLGPTLVRGGGTLTTIWGFQDSV